tara:strand:- start:2919 stop:5714 length:2796 start_codon:yes stop_codon:yes gene_type:complete
VALPAKEVELLREGLQSTTASKGSFALNMHYFQESWHVRKGFGQRFQRSTEFSTPFFGLTRVWGYREHLGSTLIKTSFGHEQIISAFTAFVRTGAGVGSLTQNLTTITYIITVDDLTTGDHWEEALYPHTSQQSASTSATQTASDTMGLSLPRWHGCYETSGRAYTGLSSESKDNAAWVASGSETLLPDEMPKPFFFTEFRDTVFFGNQNAGLWCYFPCSFKESRRKSVNQLYESEWMEPYSESSCITRASMTNGPFADGYPYFSETMMESPRAVAMMGSRLVHAGERTLYFSDAGFPTSVLADNYVVLDCQDKITALQEQMGNLLIFTKSETYLYRPNRGLVVSGGQLDKLSESIGCENSECVVKARGAVFWADSTGIHTTPGNLSISTISDPIDDLFTDFITNPLTSYYAQSGMTDASRVQPKTVTKYNAAMLHLTWAPKLDSLFITMPSENASLCFSSGKWSLWTTESNVFVSGGVDVVGATQEITKPWLVANEKGLHMIGSMSNQAIADTARYAGGSGTPVGNDVRVQSYYVLEYGRGGGIDRSVDNEDQRKPSGYFQTNTPTTIHPGWLYFDKPFQLEVGYKLPNVTLPVTSSDVYMVQPISIVCPDTRRLGLDLFYLNFDYDIHNWTASKTAGANCLMLFPSERCASMAGTWGAVEVGSTITVSYAIGAGPVLNVSVGKKTTMLYLVFKKSNNTASVSSPAIQVNTVAPPFVDRSGAGNQYLNTAIWNQYYLGTSDQSFEDNVAQPVDWAYKSDHVGMGEGVLFKARGLYMRLMSHGPGNPADWLEPNWTTGLLNTLASGDRKGWMSQVIDYTGTVADGGPTVEAIERIPNHSTIRTRVYTSTPSLVNETFATPGVTWGASGAAASGTYLIDDEQTSMIATSDSVKGGCFSYMLFGHIQNRAQALQLESVKSAFRMVGGRRRTGH